MTRSRMRNISKFLAKTAKLNPNNERIKFRGETGTIKLIDSSQASSVINSIGATYELTQDSLAVTGLTAGKITLVESAHDGARLYLSNGSGWYNVSLVNIKPTFDSDLNATFTIVDSVTSLIITNPATDSDTLTYSGTASDSGQYLVNISNDSSVWTFDPLSADSVHSNVTAGNIPDSNGGDFTYTFQASDGINTATKTVTITYSGLAAAAFVPYGGDNLYFAGEAASLLSKFAMVSDTNAATIPAISFTEHKYHHTGGGMSSTHGYIFGAKSSAPYPSGPGGNLIEKFPFANEDAISSTGYTLDVSKGIGQNKEGIGNRVNIYTAGGTAAGILKFITSSEANAASIGNPVSTTNPAFLGGITGHSSETHGYMAGGYQAPATGSNVIQKFPFSVDEGATDVGDLTYSSWSGSGSSSTTHGYHAGGYKNPPSSPYPISTRNDIQKFAFASDGNATDVGDLSADGGHRSMGGSSPSNGYQIGNADTPNIIEKYSFSSDGNATDIANFGTNAGYINDGFGSQDAAG